MFVLPEEGRVYAHLGESSNIVEAFSECRAVLAEVEAVSEETLISARASAIYGYVEREATISASAEQAGCVGLGQLLSRHPVSAASPRP